MLAEFVDWLSMIFFSLLPILAPVFIATGVGFVWARLGKEYPSDFIGRLVINIGTPCLIIVSMAQTDVQLASIYRVALAAAGVFVVTGVGFAVLLKAFGQSIHTYLPPTVLPNNGNMGLPVCLFAFGEEGLALALGYFLVMMLFTFTAGIAVVAGGGRWRDFALSVVRQPVLWAMAIAVAVLICNWQLPLWLSNTLELLGGFAIPLMMITLGVSLAQLKVRRWHRSIVFSMMRLAGGLLAGWLLCWALDLKGVERGVVLLQSAMPVAVFTYLLALRYERDHQEVAAIVIASTIMAFIGMPVLLWWVLPPA
ncbi:AEC family transporter [Gilvimarinus sp. SDUM040013]|uniref:AEC family transporter n=1 Tax=Gilvimarinus gilvus TaxID=3058038 RepID=A0ABU4RVF4_9GAMM|nr:AEC family transporter [Gilvimarinus sp. SDUM040013]MDO3386920.1 AEC family transporter [Gilvimarinus sp. SDUM040013]MDX6848186.1 AEC family transporter [Gilvimarinus sp. SDUM040013]